MDERGGFKIVYFFLKRLSINAYKNAKIDAPNINTVNPPNAIPIHGFTPNVKAMVITTPTPTRARFNLAGKYLLNYASFEDTNVM